MIWASHRVFLSLGSNLGDRAGYLTRAIQALDTLECVSVIAVSPVYETEPLGIQDQPAFLNITAEIETALPPLELLNVVKGIERELGRVDGTRWGPRLIDIDLVMAGDTVVSLPGLNLPHSEFRSRAFVLAPLADIAPEAVDPVSGRSIRELLEMPEVIGQVKRMGSLDLTDKDVTANTAVTVNH